MTKAEQEAEKKRKSAARKRKATLAANAKKPTPRRRKAAKSGKVDVKFIATLLVGAFLAIFASPMIAKKFPKFAKYSGPLLAGVGVLLASKGKGNTRIAGAGLAVGGSLLGFQSYKVTQDVNKIMNGPSRIMNGPTRLINGPSKIASKRPSHGSQSNTFGSALASGAPAY